MVPFVLPGSTLFVSRAEAAQIMVGDLVCYIDAAFSGTVHRVVRISWEGDAARLWVRGDAHVNWEEIPVNAVVYVVRKVSLGPIAYHCDSRVGTFIARLALSERFPVKVFQSALTTMWRGAVWMHRKIHQFR